MPYTQRMTTGNPARRRLLRPLSILIAAGMLAALLPTPAQAQSPRLPMLPPPSQRLFMISDSVGLGAIPQMKAAFPGWQVTVTGKPGLFTEQLASNYVQPQPASVFGDSAIVATGYNYPYWDPPRFDRAIDQMVNTLKGKGVKRIYWVTMREITPAIYSKWYTLSSAYRTLYLSYPVANNQLRNAQSRHPELSIIDWAAVSNQVGLTYDAIHLNPTGAGRYSYIASDAVYTGATRRPAGSITEITVAGQYGVPADAIAVAVNLAAVNPRRYGYVTAYPCGAERPVVSNLNFRPNEIVSAGAVVPIGVDGKICIYHHTDMHLVVDVNGAFGADSGFVPLVPARAIDTRDTTILAANTVLPVRLGGVGGAPEGQFTAVINLSVVNPSLDTEVTLYTCGTTRPAAPSRTVRAGFVQALLMVVATDANGDVCVVTNRNAHVVVDVFGAFPTDADIHPFTALRAIDTRGGAIPAAGTVSELQVRGQMGVPESPAPSAAIIALNLSNPQGMGWATAYPCAAGLPGTAMINVVPSFQQTTGGIVPLDANGRLCVFQHTSAHVMVDVHGWTGTAFSPLTPARALDTRVG